VKWLIALVVWITLATPAFANPEKTNSQIEKMTDSQRRQYARIWFERGRDQFERLRHYDEAIASFSESYRYDPRPLILFDIGNVARVAGMNDVAADYFKRYLKAAGPLDAEVAEARHWLTKLGQEPRDERGPVPAEAPAAVAPSPAAVAPAPGATAAPVAATATARDDAARGRTKLLAGIAVGGAGVVLAATGIGLLVHSGSISDQLVADGHAGHFDPALYSRGQNEQVAGAVLIGVGAAAAVAGTVVAILGARQRRQHRAAELAPRGAGSASSSAGLGLGGAGDGVRVGFGGAGFAIGWP
jgi:hypothetical protein